jgi:flagellar export protein FliJ
VTSGTSFRFRLERIRALRERKEKLAQQQLALAISRRSSTEAELLRAEADVEQARAAQRGLAELPSAVSATELQVRQAFLERVEAAHGQRAQELQLRQADVADRDANLTRAAGEHEMLKRLRERHRGDHNREAARRERNLLDEIAAVRFGRNGA